MFYGSFPRLEVDWQRRIRLPLEWLQEDLRNWTQLRQPVYPSFPPFRSGPELRLELYPKYPARLIGRRQLG